MYQDDRPWLMEPFPIGYPRQCRLGEYVYHDTGEVYAIALAPDGWIVVTYIDDRSLRFITQARYFAKLLGADPATVEVVSRADADARHPGSVMSWWHGIAHLLRDDAIAAEATRKADDDAL